MRVMSASTDVTSSTKRSAAIILRSHAPISSRSGANAEVTLSREAIVARCNGAAGSEIPSSGDFLHGERRGLPARPAPSPRQLDALDDQGQLGGLDGHGRQPAAGRERRAKAPLLEALGPHREAVAVPVHDADAVTPLGEEDEEVAAQRVVPQLVANERHQAVGALASVDRLRRDE